MTNQRLLSLTLVFAAVLQPAVGKKVPDAESRQFHLKQSRDQQTLHILERLTFGPAPGDMERVQKLGLKKWIDLQLHPERIRENPILAAKLKPLESLQMTAAQIVAHYPTPQMVRAVATGRAQLPADPELRVVVARLADRYRRKQQESQTKESEAEVEPRVPLKDLLDADQMRTLTKGTGPEKQALLESFDREQRDALVAALPGNLRQQLLPLASADLRRKLLLNAAPQQVVADDLGEGKMYRAIYSNRQLEELLADFWYNHFNVFLDKGADRYLVSEYERDTIRPHVLGRFKDLLRATAESPAMLFYLDNWESVAPQPAPRQAKGRVRGLNENYARELLELHTLGVDGGYTQHDIVEVARCFTGWTIRDPRKGGGFFFNPRVHDRGEKRVLGARISAGGGMEDGLKVLDILVRHPSTARFISKKLAQRFVADNPPPELIDRMAKTFRSKNGDIREVLKTMFSAPEFWSLGAYRAKVKTPLEMVASAARALNAQVASAFGLGGELQKMGQPLYRKLEPTGYSSANAEWISSAALLERMNFALALAANKVPGVVVDGTQFTGSAGDPMQIARALLFTDASDETRQAIEKAATGEKFKDPAAIAGLVIGSPDFQRR